MFEIVTQVSWMKNQLQKLKLTGLNEIFGTYPVIQKQFFKDLIANIEKYPHYWAEKGFKVLLMGGKQYEPHDWIFIAATDFRDRTYQLLFSRSYELGGSGAMAAAGPIEFTQFLKEVGKPAIVPTLSLINDHDKMKSVAIIISSPQEAQLSKQAMKGNLELQRFKAWVDQMKSTKNVDGQWFPTHEPICPICNERMIGIADIRVGFVKMICPRCGHEQNQSYR